MLFTKKLIKYDNRQKICSDYKTTENEDQIFYQLNFLFKSDELFIRNLLELSILFLSHKINKNSINHMNKEEPILQESQSSINSSSSSSYSEIIPRQDDFTHVRKDEPIVIRSIPMNKHKLQTILTTNNNQAKKQSTTLINSTHTYTTLSQSNITAEVYKNGEQSSRQFSSTKVIGNEEKSPERQLIFNQDLVKSTYEKYHQKQPPIDNRIQAGIRKQDLASQQKSQNMALDFSMSSVSSQKAPTIIPSQPFKKYIDSSSSKIQSQNNQQVKQYLDAIKELRRQQQSRGITINTVSNQIETLTKKNHELEMRIREYENLIKTQTESMIMERKANQIYTDFYHTLSKIVTKFITINQHQFSLPNNQSSEPLNQSLNMEKILQTIQKLIDSFSTNANVKLLVKSSQTQTEKTQPPKQSPLKLNQFDLKIQKLQLLLQTAQHKNAQLRNQLLQSTQNNINAIFNTQISASCCLQNQVTKINSQMTFLKEKMNLLILKNQPTIMNQQPLPPKIIYLSQPTQPQANPFNQSKQNNMVKIYTTKSRIRESDDESQSIEGNDHRKRRHSLSRKKKRSLKSERQRSQSSISSKSTKKREQLSKKQIQNLKQAYNQTKNQLNSLIQTFSLITSSQNQMKGYFSQVKDQIIRSMNEKIQQNEDEVKRKLQIENERIRGLQERNKLQRKLNQQQQTKIKLQLAQKIKMKEESYVSHIEFMKLQRQQDRKVIQNLNQKVVELLDAIAVPQRVNQEQYRPKNDNSHEEEIPLSQISVSVDYLKLIEQLKVQKLKQQDLIQTLIKQNAFLKEQIIELKAIQQRSRLIKNISDSQKSSNQEKESIINELNGFTEMCIPPSPLMITTGQNYHINQSEREKPQKSSKHVTFKNFNSSVAGRVMPIIQKIESQKLVKVRTDSQKNLQNNFKVILQSKQTHIKSLQQQIINLEQTIEYLKAQIISKEKVIDELENYVSNLENRSLNSVSLSSPPINLPEPNPYTDQNNSQDFIKHKYENYVKNLKLLLKETRNQNKFLKQQLQNFETQVDQRTQINFDLKNSATHSQRTTKNFPNSSPIHIHHKTSTQVVIRKRTDNTDKYQNQRQQQKINILAHDNEIIESAQNLKTKGKYPLFE